MKVRKVEFRYLRYPLTRRHGDANGLKSQRTSVIVRLQTEDGPIGWGEFFGSKLVVQHCREAAALLEGQDAFASAPLLDRIAQTSPLLAAGLDLALWDLRGKAAGMSIATLLGGPYRSAQPAYASLQNVSEAEDVIGAAVEEAVRALDLGYKALKMKIAWHAPEVDLAWIGEVLQAIPAGVPLAIDANRGMDLGTARRFARRLPQPERIAWFEEPLSKRHPAAYRELRAAVEVPIAGGETMATEMLEEVVAGRAMDIINPDLVGHGGIRRLLRLFALCDAAGVRLVPHVFDGQLIRVATLSLLAAQPDWDERQSPFPTSPLECDVTPNPLRDELLLEPLRCDREGRIPVPTGPGLGVEINEALLDRYAVPMD